MEPIGLLFGIAIAFVVGYFSGRSYAERQHDDEIDRLNKRIADLEGDNPTNPTA